MLGRLQMSVSQCIDAYATFAREVFGDPVSKWRLQEGRFKAINLEAAVQKIVKEQAQGDKMFDTRQAACKVYASNSSRGSFINPMANSFVCAIPAASVNRARRLCTYDRSVIGECTIWEAARATSAAPTFFEAADISIRPGITERFVDGAMGHNNPVQELYAEAKNVFPHVDVDCIISLGTGSSARGELSRPRLWERKIPTNVIDALKHITVNCQKSHEAMLEQFKDKPDVYFRFNVDAGLEKIGLGEWERLGDVRSITLDYLAGFEARQRMAAAAKILQQSLRKVSTGK
jgi:hypothetical protein